MGDKISHCVESYEEIGTDWDHINLLKRGYKPSWIGKAPTQSAAARNLTLSALASNIHDMKAQGLLEKGAICKVEQIQGQYVSSYFALPKSKRYPDK